MYSKFFKFTISLIFISIAFSVTIFAKSRWVKVGDNWRYEVHEGGGDYVTEKFRAIYDADGVTEKVYYFDYHGNMVTGPVLIYNELYAFGEDGAAIKTGFDIDGIHFETSGNGKVLNVPAAMKSRFKQVDTMIIGITPGSQNNNLYDNNSIIAPTASSNK